MESRREASPLLKNDSPSLGKGRGQGDRLLNNLHKFKYAIKKEMC